MNVVVALTAILRCSVPFSAGELFLLRKKFVFCMCIVLLFSLPLYDLIRSEQALSDS